MAYMKEKINIKLITLFFLLSSFNAHAVLEAIHLGTFGSGKAWQAKQYGEGDSKICFMISKPIQTSPTGLNRGDHALMLSNFVSDGIIVIFALLVLSWNCCILFYQRSCNTAQGFNT